MKISVFGLGYVGVVSAGCLAASGHEVIGVDPNKVKVDLINAGKSPIIEAGIDDLIAKAAREKRLMATHDVYYAVKNTNISLICVGTPSQHNGNLDLKFVGQVCEEIGLAIGMKTGRHTVVIRSTVLPGTMRSLIIPTLERMSGKKAGTDFGLCNNPEFLREGTAVYDYSNPPKTVIGEIDKASGDILAKLYQHHDAPLIRTTTETAEMVKYIDNTWHALKVTFANEVGSICKALQIDSHAVMDVFCQDHKLNIAPTYLKPGFAFGGSCLPKDVRALCYKARNMDLDVPLLNTILPSNRAQIEHGISLIEQQGNKRIGILGISFKAGTDDLRESPLITIVETLLGRGYDIRIYDQNVSIACLTGANRDYILNVIPHIHSLMADSLDSVLAHAQTIVIGNADAFFSGVPEKLKENQKLVDLVRIRKDLSTRQNYSGICW